MPKKYLIDTCVWRDFYEDRFSKTGNPLEKYATSLFLKIINAKDTIIFSETLIRELKKDYYEKDIDDLLCLFLVNNILLKIEITKKEYKKPNPPQWAGIFNVSDTPSDSGELRQSNPTTASSGVSETNEQSIREDNCQQARSCQ